MLVKMYGPWPEGQRRFSPAICTGARKTRIEGNPEPLHQVHGIDGGCLCRA